MSPDNLEKYILDHREAFDDLEPDSEVWERINTRPAPVRRINWSSIGWKAAAAVALFISSYFFHDFMASRNAAPSQQSAALEKEASPLVTELIEAEAYYTARINLKKDEVFRLTAQDPDLRSEIDMELVDLDRIFLDLKDDLNDNAANEEVIEAMIQNYRLKLEILEEMLTVLNQSNEQQHETDHESAVEL